MKNYEEILKELKNAKVSIENIEKILSITEKTNLIKNKLEYKKAIEDLAVFLSKKSDANSIRGMKHRLEKGKRKIEVEEAYIIQEKFGIPIYAWKDIEWFQKTLPPK